MPELLSESVVEQAVLGWLGELKYAVAAGPDLAPEGATPERATFADVILVGRLRAALVKLNPTIPADAIEEAVRKVTHADTPSLIENNRRLHALLTDGVDVEVRRDDGSVGGDKVWLIDFADPDGNDFLAVNQFTVTEDRHTRRMDVVVFVNGLPLAVLELKNPTAENATAKDAFQQLQTYKAELPALFGTNVLLVASDGLEARVGTLTADWERFMPWRTIDGQAVAPKGMPELDVLVKGVFARRRLLDLLRHFVVFEVDGPKVVKKLAGYHQYHAVNKAVNCTVAASAPDGDRKVGVIWHTQGSGKSLTMAFYAGKVVRHDLMNNPTLLVLTDRNDLDDQLFATFAGCRALLRQTPVQAEGRDDLREKLKVASGGVIFTTIQKFAPAKGEKYPRLSERANIVVVADEAHRSQYGLEGKVDQKTGDIDYGFAKHLRDALPNASFVGFTGTPVEQADRNTPQVFGEYIDIYDIHRAVEDGATVKIYYEGRLAKLDLKESEKPKLDAEFEEVTEGEEQDAKEKAKTRWARLEALVGSEKRVALVAKDLVEHFERRLEAMDGKAMVVCMSRRICVDLYDQIVKLRPQWHDPDDAKGAVKIVMTGSAKDDQGWQDHIRTKARREALAKRLKDPKDPLKLVIVRDMWLTGFDAPCLHTMYTDKPMKGHGLMQAIARVNRVFKDKPGGLVVDYLGLAEMLKRALAEYTEGDREEAGVPVEKVVEQLQETVEVVRAMLHGFDYQKFFTGPPGERLAVLAGAREFVLEQDRKTPRKPDSKEPDAKTRYMAAVAKLTSLLALAMPHETALELRDEVAFFQGVRAGFVKLSTGGAGQPGGDTDSAIRQLISKAVASEQVIDIFAAAGLKKPDISILSDEFLAEIRGLPHRNLALELLQKLLGDEIKGRAKKNLIQSRSFAAMLEQAIRAYQNRSLESAQVIEQLIALARDMREAHKRGDSLGMSDDEIAFYDALEVSDSAVRVLGDDKLRLIARELVETVRKNTTIDWTLKEGVKANLRRLVRRILNNYGYPPDMQPKAVQTVLEQAELLAKDWAA
ncbi:MAG: type I restriction endonuclease subunit R [Gemmataceae bacterium]|nr:type I restriction endonuclease subunit R [Gemmataceae bacterium]